MSRVGPDRHNRGARATGTDRPISRSTFVTKSAAPDFILAPTELGKLRGAQRRFFRGKELVELRRLDSSRAQHRMRLAAMMNLVLEQMQQQPVHPLMLNATAAVDVDDAIEIFSAEALDEGDQPAIHLALRIPKQDNRFA